MQNIKGISHNASLHGILFEQKKLGFLQCRTHILYLQIIIQRLFGISLDEFNGQSIFGAILLEKTAYIQLLVKARVSLTPISCL